MDPRPLQSHMFLMDILPCTISTIFLTKLEYQCLGSTLKAHQPYTAQVEADRLLFPLITTKLMVKCSSLLVALEALDILNFLLKENQPVLFLLLIVKMN